MIDVEAPYSYTYLLLVLQTEVLVPEHVVQTYHERHVAIHIHRSLMTVDPHLCMVIYTVELYADLIPAEVLVK